MTSKYTNIKNGKTYIVLNYAVEKTNSRDGTVCVVYYEDGVENLWYVRGKNEFLEKFAPLEE